jgi:FtsP/CotA-like multicopper oxidase with cupredoxin domain
MFLACVSAAHAQQESPELVQLTVCSAATAGKPALKGICSVKPLHGGGNEVKIQLTAQTGPIDVGGYRVTTGNYNGNYLTPVVEAMPGDSVAARLMNILDPLPHGRGHGGQHANQPTNLHYFHGGIVTPGNAPPKPTHLGDGDNVYVLLESGRDAKGNPKAFEFNVPIPGDGKLDARVLESTGFIPHPLGLNWYHSHLHGISSDQVMGGMSGLLSTGAADANVKADCRKDSAGQATCDQQEKDTAELRRRTLVRYALLRDLPLRATVPPEAAVNAAARFAPEDRDLHDSADCGVWKADGSGLDMDAKRRKGYCQLDTQDKDSVWLFTLNGQRFPTITVPGGRNLLLRLGNLSANVPYWLELYNEADEKDVLPLTILSLDGVVPARPALPDQAAQALQAINYLNLLMMPATRAEIYVRNDEKPHAARKVYILRTRGFQTFQDKWPTIELARIVLEPNATESKVAMARNALLAKAAPKLAAAAVAPKKLAAMPVGCVRDLDPSHREYRRVTFLDGGMTSQGEATEWSVLTEIVRPSGKELAAEDNHKSPDPDISTVGMKEQDGSFSGIPFEEYVLKNGLVDWDNAKKKRVCIKLDNAGSHKQLWVLRNATARLHNFHIHQMKFRLATAAELAERSIAEPEAPSTCPPAPAPCDEPDIKFYDNVGSPKLADPGANPVWHDTIPIPAIKSVYVIMSFDAQEQLGRFVFHCHILKHEDKGLMAPIEVWSPTANVFQ